MDSASQGNIRLERSSWAFDTSVMSNTLVILFHELDKFHFNDDQILHHHYSVPDPQYTDNEKHFGKSCQNVFPVVSMCIIFFGLNIFFFSCFSRIYCLSGFAGNNYISLQLEWVKPLPFSSISMPQVVLCSSSIVHKQRCHQRAQYSRWGLSMVCYKTAWSSFRLTGNKSSGISWVAWVCLSWLDHTDDNIYPDWLSDLFPFPADRFPVFSENSPH